MFAFGSDVLCEILNSSGSTILCGGKGGEWKYERSGDAEWKVKAKIMKADTLSAFMILRVICHCGE